MAKSKRKPGIAKSVGHLAFHEGFEYFNWNGNVNRARIDAEMMEPENVRPGIWYGKIENWPIIAQQAGIKLS